MQDRRGSESTRFPQDEEERLGNNFTTGSRPIRRLCLFPAQGSAQPVTHVGTRLVEVDAERSIQSRDSDGAVLDIFQ